jgi:transcriptional regulator with XRE-family HTH domain
MSARRPELSADPDHIGLRVRRWRLKRDLSQRVLADLAGLTQGYIAQIESGIAPLDKRSTQLALAKALQVSLADLTGQPYDPSSLEHVTAARHVPELRAALAELSFGFTNTPELPPSQATTSMAKITELHNACRYDELIALLPNVLLHLGSDHNDATRLRQLVWATYAATFAAKYLGYADLAMLAAQQCRAAAEALQDEPEWLG